MSQIPVQKTVFSKEAYTKVINTNFTHSETKATSTPTLNSARKRTSLLSSEYHNTHSHQLHSQTSH